MNNETRLFLNVKKQKNNNSILEICGSHQRMCEPHLEKLNQKLPLKLLLSLHNMAFYSEVFNCPWTNIYKQSWIIEGFRKGEKKKERLYNEQMVEACECDGCCWGKVAENIMDRPVFLMEARPFFLMFKTYFGIVQWHSNHFSTNNGWHSGAHG